jgi:hypothetical protein
MDLPQQAGGQREFLCQPGQTMLQPRHVAGDLDHVVEGNGRGFLQFEEQQIGEGRLGAFDLGGEQGLPPHIGVEEQLGIGQHGVFPGRTLNTAAAYSRKRALP